VSVLEELKSKAWFPWAVGGGLVLLLFWLLFWSTPDPLPTKSSKDPKGKDQKEGLYDLKIGSWQNRVDQDLEATRKQIAQMDLKQQEIRDQFKNIGDALSDLTLQMKAEKESRLAVSRAALPNPEQKAMGSGITVMRFGAAKSPATERPVKAKTEAPAVRQTSYLPGGSMARSVLLTGVDAPVGGKPFPVLLALKEAFASPNSYQVPLKGCFALGKAEGNASSERADIQIVRMSCVLPNGKAFEQEITGYLVGEDGKQGIPGKLVDKEGRKIAFAAVAGVGAGLARAFGQQQVTNVVTDSGATTSTVTGDALTFGLASGAQGAATEMQRYFQKQAERLFPVVEIDAGRNVTMVMLSGTKVPGLEAMNKTDPRRGLD
jgi:conjugal transfer pilus assembly protein TraB